MTLESTFAELAEPSPPLLLPQLHPITSMYLDGPSPPLRGAPLEVTSTPAPAQNNGMEILLGPKERTFRRLHAERLRLRVHIPPSTPQRWLVIKGTEKTATLHSQSAQRVRHAIKYKALKANHYRALSESPHFNPGIARGT